MAKSEDDVRSMWNKIKDTLGLTTCDREIRKRTSLRQCFTTFNTQLRVSLLFLCKGNCLISNYFLTLSQPILAWLIDLNFKLHYIHTVSLLLCLYASTWDRYCQQRAMANDSISPTDDHALRPGHLLRTGSSPFQHPPGWTPPPTTPHRTGHSTIGPEPYAATGSQKPVLQISWPQGRGQPSPPKHMTACSRPSR